MQSIREYVLRTHGAPVVKLATVMAQKMGKVQTLTNNLAYSGYLGLEREFIKGRHIEITKSLIKVNAIRLVQKDPRRAFLKPLAKTDSVYNATPASSMYS
jgi:hypothetical protein